ncbi:sensor histidine kinase [Halalkalibacter sp. APA_J-10(15)]|uniref:cache domain-containing sensor histidine kinase n=1 Tax=Halalkalibacter sp. APA_J-10(15) TaxID=2933805 RepID=UPI001FF6A176|nr:sensor histidine kinase [Halalkalibacter sp. APA_J-10(15)]MCK0471194.1 sensor histidine kinase [Halalkalibacter sp. APA_J-10(15)]
MLFLISGVTLAFSTGGLFILQYAFNTYNEEIYRQSAQTLAVSLGSIENELIKMERLSFQMSTDLQIQDSLRILNSDRSDYEKFMSSTDLRKRLLDVGALNQYVLSLQVYDLDNREMASGNQTVAVSEDRLYRLKTEATNEHGGLKWVLPNEEDPSLIIAREIRSYSPLSLSLHSLGMAMVRLDIEALVSHFSHSVSGDGANLMILDEHGDFIYPLHSPFSAHFLNGQIHGDNGYHLMKAEGERYFVTYHQSNRTNWMYMIVTPYSNLFEAITAVRNAVIVTYSLLFIVVLFIGTRFVRSITNPIEHLNRKMKWIQTGDYNMLETDYLKFPQDETGQMHENFKQMMKQIEFLISENYKKISIIKDTEYKVLQAQVNPHFLYNTLDSINWEAKVKGQFHISKMAESLGFILRSSINVKEALIPLEQELKIVESYTTIQAYRFEERLHFEMNVASELYSCKVPKFILQPLVDNSIRYGLQQMIGTCIITVSAKSKGECILFTVEDNGMGMAGQLLNKIKTWDYESQGNGIGLRNLQERIVALFGDEYGVSIDSEVGKGTRVEVVLPMNGGDRHVQSIVSR